MPAYSPGPSPMRFAVVLFLSLVATCSLRAQFTQPGSRFSGTGAVGGANQGTSLALSADGSTAIEGGPLDNSGVGAAWIFTVSGNNPYVQQGAKLTASDAIGNAQFGCSVAISADGNTAVIGGKNDNTVPNSTTVGAAWVFVRNGANWTQQAKLDWQ